MPVRPSSRSVELKLPEGPVVVLAGTDPYQLKQAIQQLVARNGGESACERREYDAAAQGEVKQAIVDAASPSLFIPFRIVVLQQVDKAMAADLELLLAYVKKPAADSVLVLILASQRAPKKALKEILGSVPVVRVEAISPSDVRALIRQRFKQAEIRINADALEALLDHVGNRGDDALAETEKMILWAGPGGRVDLETCQRLLTTEAEEELWAVTRGVGEKNPGAALVSLRRMFDQGIQPVFLLVMLARLFRQMWCVRVAQEEGIPPKEWPDAVGLRGYPLQVTARQARGFRRETLERGLARIRQTDEALKGGSSSPELALESLVVDLSALS